MNMPLEKSNSLYNKGVVFQNDKKTEDCILNYKNALKIDPNNIDARHNLQLALQTQKEDKQKQDEQNKKDKQDDNKNKNDQQPKPQQSNLTQKDAEQKLQALLQKEKELQDKLHKVGTSSPNKLEKDW